jgi:hypothetical protein
MSSDAYPALADLIGAWFHQDYDIEGETMPEIMAAFRAVMTPAEQALASTDIARFVAEHPDDLDEAFESTFRPGVIPSAFSGPPAEFDHSDARRPPVGGMSLGTSGPGGPSCFRRDRPM